MTRDRMRTHSKEELDAWLCPAPQMILPKYQLRVSNACTALRSLLLGEMSLTKAADENGLCRKRLRSMAERAPRLAPDGQLYGFRVCVPWGGYCKTETPVDADTSMPKRAEPHALAGVFRAQPHIGAWVSSYSRPLPPGRPPRSFDQLHAKVVKELKRLDLHDYYPLNQEDKGRRALLRYIRALRIETAPMPSLEVGELAPPTALAEIFRGQPFDRLELDGHRIDIEALLQIQGPSGKVVTRPVTTLWFIPDVECESRAILSWTLRVGRNYNNEDVTGTISQSMRPWVARELTIPDLAYAPGAGMPSNSMSSSPPRRGRLMALDNHKGHQADHVQQSFCRAHDGILTYGRPHQPRTRPIIEQLFSRLEKGAFRHIAGGFEPAARLGDNKIRISNFAPEDHPIQLHLLEELLDVIVANYNATPHPSLGDLSPLQYLKQRSFEHLWYYAPSDADACSIDMDSVLVSVTVHGNKKSGEMPHINYAYVRYRSPELDKQWELIGQTFIARIFRSDLRTIVLYRSATKPIGVLRAVRPWSLTRHDETTRKMIHQWSRQKGGLQLKGVECAIAAYVHFLRSAAKNSQQAVDQLARIQQQHPGPLTTQGRHPLMETPVRAPRRGWVSMDDMRDA